jgi:hypothetical protein
MKTIEVSDDAFLIIDHYAKRRTNGDIVAYIDRLVGATKERRDYEELPLKASAFLTVSARCFHERRMT